MMQFFGWVFNKLLCNLDLWFYFVTVNSVCEHLTFDWYLTIRLTASRAFTRFDNLLRFIMINFLLRDPVALPLILYTYLDPSLYI